jgi:hypothetical protein
MLDRTGSLGVISPELVFSLSLVKCALYSLGCVLSRITESEALREISVAG